MKKINSFQKFTKQLLIASLVILTSFSVAEAQRGGGGGRGGSGGGGRGFGGGGGGRISAAPRGGGFGGGARISAAPRGGFGGGNRIAVGPRFAPGRGYAGGLRGGISVGRPGYGYRGGYYGRPYYGIGYGAYYRSYYPHIGFYLNVLPFGYYPFYYGGYPYYYDQGLFYQQYNGGYQVVAPPIGAEVPRLPRRTKEITIDGQQYFEKDGIYYQPVVDQDGRKVYRIAGKDGVLNTDGGAAQQDDQQQYAGDQQQSNDDQQQQQPTINTTPNNNGAMPRVGDVVNAIPSESRPVKINGEKLYVSPDGVYYQEDNSGNTRIFKVVGVPTSDDVTDNVSNP